MTDSKTQIGRLAFRVEGDNWCAYYALTDSMVDAVPLATIRMKLVANQDRRKAFMTLMTRRGRRPHRGSHGRKAVVEVAPRGAGA